MSEFFRYGKDNKEINFEQFRSKLESGDVKNNKALKELFSVFDIENHNGVIDTDKEALSLFMALQNSAMSDNNMVLDDKEITAFIKNLQITDEEKGLTKIYKSLTKFLDKISTEPTETVENYTQNAQDYTEDEIKDISIETLSDNIVQAHKVFNSQIEQEGSVSEFVDDRHVGKGSKLTSFNVNTYISEEELTAKLLQEAKDGILTERDYLEQKLALAESFMPPEPDTPTFNMILKIVPFFPIQLLNELDIHIRYENMSDAQKSQEIKIQFLRNALKNLKQENLNNVITDLQGTDDITKKNEIIENVLNQYISNFKIDTLVTSSEVPQIIGYKDIKTGKITYCKPDTIYVVKKDSETGQVLEQPIYQNQKVNKTEVNIQKMGETNKEGSVGNLITTKGEKLKTFNETFYDEMGVEYNEENIMDYTKKNAQTQFLLSMYNKKQEIYNILHDATVTVDGNNKLGAPDTRAIKPCEEKLESAIICALINLYGNNMDDIQNGLNNLGITNLKVIQQENKNMESKILKLAFDNCDQENSNVLNKIDLSSYDLVDISNKLQNKINENYEKALNGKSLEKYVEETQRAYLRAFGSKNAQAFTSEYVESQEKGIQSVKTIIQAGGMVVMVAGQLIPLGGQLATGMVMGGVVTSTAGGVAVDAVENFTKNGGITEEDKKEMLKELGISMALLASGGGIGKVSEAAFRTLVLRNCPKLLAFASEVGIDATMSMVADYAITGQIDLSGEGVAQLQNILVGILRSKGKFRTYIDTHVGDITKPNTTTNEKISLGSNNDATAIATTINREIDVSEKRKSLKEKLKSGIPTKNTEAHIDIPKGRFAAPSTKFAETPEAFQKAVRENAEDIKGIIDLFQHGELTKEEAFSYIIERLNVSYDISGYSPDVSVGRRGAYGEYREWLNKIDMNETLDLDMLIAEYSHEIGHFFQAKEINETFLTVDGSLDNKFRAHALSELRPQRARFSSNAEYENAVAQRTRELKQLYERTNWNDILNQPKYRTNLNDEPILQRGIDLHNANVNGYENNYHGHMHEVDSYTIGTATYIELQRSVMGTINEAEYNLLNDINIVLHDSYNELPANLQKVTREINLHPKQFVDDVKFITRECAGSIDVNDRVTIIHLLSELYK